MALEWYNRLARTPAGDIKECQMESCRISPSLFRLPQKSSLLLLPAMRILHQPFPSFLKLIPCLSLVAYGIPHEGSISDDQANLERVDKGNYVVTTRDSTDAGQAAAIKTSLMTFVKDEDKVYICNTGEEALFFSVPLTPEEAEKVRAEPNVRLTHLAEFRLVILTRAGCECCSARQHKLQRPY